VGDCIDNVGGTSADLNQNDKFSVWELLFGLMLPSGNDAAVVLAEYFGNLLIKEKER
jgi:D-alanyl-D-alanine carboxypeptidase